MAELPARTECPDVGRDSRAGGDLELHPGGPRRALPRGGRRGAGVRALAAIPLVAKESAIGAISFSFAEPRQFSAEDTAFVAAIVQQAAYALERTRLYEAERRARKGLSFLATASEVLNESLDARRTLQRLAEVSVLHFSDWCEIDLLDDQGEIRTVVVANVDRRREEHAQGLRRAHPLEADAEIGIPEAIRSGETRLYEQIGSTGGGLAGEELAIMRALELSSALVVPLAARGRVLGAISFASSDPDWKFGPEEVGLAEDLARRTALAIDTSTLYQREHETALTLQRALLPSQLPEVEGVELAARYLPAEAGLEVGGDWYDVIQSAPGRIEVVIGDVAGRGVQAAAVMGRLAMALRAHVLAGHVVEDAVAGLDMLMKASEYSDFATLFELSLDISSGAARYVRAGHPPALLRHEGGEVIELSGEGSPPVGPVSRARFVTNEVTFRPGSTLLLYTDGLIERRRLDLQIGIDRLKSAFSAGPGEPKAALEAIPAALDAENIPDDIALLALRFTGRNH